jgi:flagellar hook-basal body complex protein FliE
MITSRTISQQMLPDLAGTTRADGSTATSSASSTATTGTPPAASFGEELALAVQSVDAQTRAADDASAKLASGGGNIHETALALEKADVSMRLLLKVRNKAVEAYQELSRMPV